MVSVGGQTDHPLTSDPAALATDVVSWARTYLLDGVDFDVEDIQVGFRTATLTPPQVVSWLVTASQVARAAMGSGPCSMLLTHAPQVGAGMAPCPAVAPETIPLLHTGALLWRSRKR